MSAGERGALLHAALFHTFDALSSSEHLSVVAPHQQATIVTNSVDKALSSIKSQTRDRVGLEIIDLERNRLKAPS